MADDIERIEAAETKVARKGAWLAIFLLGAAAGAIATMTLMPDSDRGTYDDAAGASDPR